MICPFCREKLYCEGWFDDDNYLTNYCTNIQCLVNNDYSRYRCKVSKTGGKVLSEEYQLDPFYVKVTETETCIYRINHCVLEDEVKVPRCIMINPEKIDETLDKLKLLITFS